MCKEKIIYNRTRQTGQTTLPLPDIPESEWCDFRRDYESGMTLKAIAEKYICDSRTVRSCIISNNPSCRLGSQMGPTKLDAYVDLIDELFGEMVRDKEARSQKIGVCEISKRITQELQKRGYSGSERTVRNYLNCHYQFVVKPQKNREETQNA